MEPPVNSPAHSPQATQPAGIYLFDPTAQGCETARQRFLTYLAALGLDGYVATVPQMEADLHGTCFRLGDEFATAWAPDFDTTALSSALALNTMARDQDLEREIVLALLLAPVAFRYPSYDELASAVRIKKNIVQAARKTELAFDTDHAERPADYWTYDEERGFTILPGKPLVDALRKATQPENPDKLYSFSCYRATEYVTLLGIAQELANCNPPLFQRLQRQWETRAIMSGRFHEVFLREYGSMQVPLPPKYYVPGDRLWFRNPDEHSSNVEGYEGSWVFYLGGGLFTNFWKHEQPFTLTSKCVEIFHWRHGTYTDADGKLKLNESVVEERVRASLADPAQVRDILAVMLRLRDPQGVYVDGGCIDTTRECVRWVCSGTADLALPAA